MHSGSADRARALCAKRAGASAHGFHNQGDDCAAGAGVAAFVAGPDGVQCAAVAAGQAAAGRMTKEEALISAIIKPRIITQFGLDYGTSELESFPVFNTAGVMERN